MATRSIGDYDEGFEVTRRLEASLRQDEGHLCNVCNCARRSAGLSEVMSINAPSPVSEQAGMYKNVNGRHPLHSLVQSVQRDSLEL